MRSFVYEPGRTLILTLLSLVFFDRGLSFIGYPRRSRERLWTWSFSNEKDLHAFTIFLFTDLFIRLLYHSLSAERTAPISFIRVSVSNLVHRSDRFQTVVSDFPDLILQDTSHWIPMRNPPESRIHFHHIS